MQNTPKEAKVLRTFDLSHSLGPTLTLRGACKEEAQSSTAKALNTELALEADTARATDKEN